TLVSGLGCVCQTLTVSGLVVQERDLLVGEALEDERTCNTTLLVVTTAHAEDARARTVFGIGRVGRRRGDLNDVIFSIDLRRRDGRARAEVTCHEHNALTSHVVGHVHGLTRIAGIVTHFENQLLTEHAASSVDVRNGKLGTGLKLCAEGRVLTGWGSAKSDLEICQGMTTHANGGSSACQ